MAYAQNAFGVTSFGESTEPTDVTVTLTGVTGSIDVNGAALGVASISRVIIGGVEGTLQVGTVGIGMGIVPTGVSATGAIDDLTIDGGTGATPTITGVSATGNVTDGDSFSTFTAEGNAQLSTAQQKFGTASLLLDGTDDYVESDSNIDLSSGDFTVDMWIRPDNVTGYKGLFQSGTSSLLRAYLIADKVRLSVGPSTIIFTSTTGIAANTWTMISIEREGNTHRLYINGTLEETASNANRPDNGVFSVGTNSFGDFDGYIDEVRLSNVAQYTGTGFTEPTSAFTVDDNTLALLHFDGTNASTDIVNAANLAHVNVSAGFGPTVTLTGFELQGITDSPLVDGDEVIITSDADVSLDGKGVSGTVAVDTVTLECKAVVIPTGVQGTFTVGDETINAVQFDYESIKADYSRQRTVFVHSDTNRRTRAYVRAA